MTKPSTKLYLWGSDSHGQLGVLDGQSPYKTPQFCQIQYKIKRIACGEKHIIFLNDQGVCYSQGSNQNGQLGIDNKQVQFSAIPLRVQLPSPAIKIFCGLSYSFALLQNKQIYGWGLNEQGILGSQHLNISWKPIKLKIDNSFKIKTISCGALHCGFVTQQGDLLMSGSNQYGELGFSKKEKVSNPTQLDVSFNVVEIACGVFYTLLLDNNGKVYSFGNNKYGQLGNGTKHSENFPKKIKFLENQFVVKISAGYHSGALTNRGQLFIWGSGTFGQYLIPHRIQSPGTSNFYVEFSIGGFFGIALDKLGQVYTWGNNTNGQLGQGHFKSLKYPTAIPELKDVERIYCGHNFVIVLPKRVHSRSLSQAPQRLNIRQNSVQYKRKQYPSIQKAVSNFKKTVHQLQSKQNKLQSQKQQLQIKFQSLSDDFEKLVDKYELIQRIVSEKQRMIAIYEQQIKQSSVRLFQSQSVVQKYHAIVIENDSYCRKLSDKNRQIDQFILTIQNLKSTTDSLRNKNQSLLNTHNTLIETNDSLNSMCQSLKKANQSLKQTNTSLKISQKQLKSQVKNQKHLELEKGLDQIIKSKDTQIEQLIKSNTKLTNDLQKLQQKVKQDINWKHQYEVYKEKVLELEEILIQRQDELNQLYQQQNVDKNVKRFSGFMCSPSERSYCSKQRLSPVKIKIQNKSIYQSNSKNNNPVELKRVIRWMQNQILYLQSQIQAQKQVQKKQQQEIQQQMLVSAQLKDDIRNLQGSLTLSESQHTNSKTLLNKYQTVISVNKQQHQQQISRLQKLQLQYKNKQTLMKKQINRLKQQGYDLKQRISIIEQRQNESLCIIKAQKRQIQDLRALETDIDAQSREYKNLLTKLSEATLMSDSLKQKLVSKQKSIKQLQSVILLQRQQKISKIQQFQNQISRLNQIKQKLHQNGNELFDKNSELQSKIQDMNLEQTKIKCLITKLQSKLNETCTFLEQYKQKSSKQQQQITSLKRDIKALTTLKNELEVIYQQSVLSLETTTQQKDQYISLNKDLNQQITQLTKVLESKVQEISQLKDLIIKKQKQVEGLKINIQDIKSANSQYSSNEDILMNKVKELEKHTSDLENALEELDYSSKDLGMKNIELDKKNRQLADMLNKSIQQQALQYKHKIMSEVAHNANIILQNFSQCQTEKRQNQSCENSVRQIRQFGYQITNRNVQFTTHRPKNSSPKKQNKIQQTPQQKYNKMLTSKILQNKRKISQSANKLCSLLDFKQTNEDSYIKINNRIQLIDEQKDILLSKLSSYTKKLQQL